MQYFRTYISKLFLDWSTPWIIVLCINDIITIWKISVHENSYRSVSIPRPTVVYHGCNINFCIRRTWYALICIRRRTMTLRYCYHFQYTTRRRYEIFHPAHVILLWRMSYSQSNANERVPRPSNAKIAIFVLTLMCWSFKSWCA